jgi:hypothetical protein
LKFKLNKLTDISFHAIFCRKGLDPDKRRACWCDRVGLEGHAAAGDPLTGSCDLKAGTCEKIGEKHAGDASAGSFMFDSEVLVLNLLSVRLLADGLALTMRRGGVA